MAVDAGSRATEAFPEAEIDTEPRQLPWWLIGAAVLFCGIGGWLFLQRMRTVYPPGELEAYKQGQFQKKYSLPSFKKQKIGVGSGQVELVLPGEDVPAFAGQVVGQQDGNGQRQAVWEVIDPDDPSVISERYVLAHGDELFVSSEYKLVYHHYQAEPSFFERRLNDDNE
jgi:hypothetical protein